MANEETIDRLLSDEPRERDPLAMAIAQARVSAALFGTAESARVGRFHVLERAGAGGMGVVYTAYDPELDRAVALKLVAVHGDRQEQAIREAKALARLSHPNVVPVHEVGIYDQHVYIVMELVRGPTLAAWTKTALRTQREIIHAYAQAGAALSAAHDAGLVHCDFKPENAIFGEDGRVRVIDFGLAHAPGESRELRVAGTPKYMAPEQAAGSSPTPAADQFSFCTALHEALRGPEASSPPRWIASVLARGLATDPNARHPSMAALLEALSRDPRRTWARRAAAAAVVLAVAFAFVIGRSAQDEEMLACSGAQDELARAWGGADPSATYARIAGLGDYGRSAAATIESALRAWKERWSDQHRDACLTHRRGEQSSALLDRRMACLDRIRAAYAALIEGAHAADATAIAGLVAAAAALPNPQRCSDLEAQMAEPELRAATSSIVAEVRRQIERVRVLNNSGRIEQACREGAEAAARARKLGEPRWLAEALFVEGLATARRSFDDASPLLAEAISAAIVSGSDEIAVEAWAQRAFQLATHRDGKNGFEGREIVEAIANRPTATAHMRAALFRRLGGMLFAAERFDEARAYRTRAVEEARRLGPEDVLLVFRTRNDLALSDPPNQDQVLAELIEDETRVLGADYPDTLMATVVRGELLDDLARSTELLSKGCEGLATLHPGARREILSCLNERAMLAVLNGDRQVALDARSRIVALDADPQSAKFNRAYVDLLEGRAQEAARGFEQDLAESPLPANPPIWEVMAVGDEERLLGDAMLALANAGEARARFERAESALAEAVRRHTTAPQRRRLFLARAGLALARDALHLDAATTASIAKSAADYLEKNGSRWSELAKLEALTLPRSR